MYEQTRLQRDGLVAVLTTDEHGSFGQLAKGDRFAIDGEFQTHHDMVNHYVGNGWAVVSDR